MADGNAGPPNLMDTPIPPPASINETSEITDMEAALATSTTTDSHLAAPPCTAASDLLTSTPISTLAPPDSRPDDASIKHQAHEPSVNDQHPPQALTGQQPSPRPLAPAPTRIPGTYPPVWLPDHETNCCMACDNVFTLIKRRHHCRSCGKIFCSDCCKQKAKLLFLDNQEARVCDTCYNLIELTFRGNSSSIANSENIEPNPEPSSSASLGRGSQSDLRQAVPGTSASASASTSTSGTSATTGAGTTRVQGVLKTSNHGPCNNSSTEQSSSKQVIFADGIRPGTDLSESFPYPLPSAQSTGSPSSASFSLLTRQQNRGPDAAKSETTQRKCKSNQSKSHHHEFSDKTVTVCDELGYLPPIPIYKNSPIAINSEPSSSSTASSLTNLIASHLRLSSTSKSIQASMESRTCPLNGVMRFEDIVNLVGINNIVTFILLKGFYLRVRVIQKLCCIDRKLRSSKDLVTDGSELMTETEDIIIDGRRSFGVDAPEYWCFTSEGLSRFGQDEVVLILDRDKADPCIPRDVFKIYLTLHELSLRRQSLENLGNLLFQDGLFGNKDTAGLLFVRPMEHHCLSEIVLPNSPFLFALILQRWEVPWSKVFPMRLLLRLGHKFGTYPYPIVSFRARDPVYYEVGHTIISILGDFRNFRYSMTHVDGLKVMLKRSTKTILVQLKQSCYHQFNKVLDSSNNEHVLAWSSCPFHEADGHLVAVQNEDGMYESVEFYKQPNSPEVTFKELETMDIVIGASFVIFSGALKGGGQAAKISVVEDGLLIQIRSSTMSDLKNAIHHMQHFEIDCESEQDPLNRVEVDWQMDESPTNIDQNLID